MAAASSRGSREPGFELTVQKLSEQGIIPHRRPAAIGYDIFASDEQLIPAFDWVTVHTKIALSVPAGYTCTITPRPGIGTRGIDTLIRTVDHTFSGEVVVILANLTRTNLRIKRGECVGQLVFTKTKPAF